MSKRAAFCLPVFLVLLGACAYIPPPAPITNLTTAHAALGVPPQGPLQHCVLRSAGKGGGDELDLELSLDRLPPGKGLATAQIIVLRRAGAIVPLDLAVWRTELYESSSAFGAAAVSPSGAMIFKGPPGAFAKVLSYWAREGGLFLSLKEKAAPAPKLYSMLKPPDPVLAAASACAVKLAGE